MAAPRSEIDRAKLHAARAKVQAERANGRVASEEELQLWMELLGKGWSRRAIAEELGMNWTGVAEVIRRAGR